MLYRRLLYALRLSTGYVTLDCRYFLTAKAPEGNTRAVGAGLGATDELEWLPSFGVSNTDRAFDFSLELLLSEGLLVRI